MNQKKSKRLRQLVRHLIAKEAIKSTGPWTVYMNDTTFTPIEAKHAVSKYHNADKFETRTTICTAGNHPHTGIQVFTDPSCGRAIYQQMKKRSQLSHRV